MLRFVRDVFSFEGRAHKCDRESEDCYVRVTLPVCTGAVEEFDVDRCLLPELKQLWKQGIKTHCSCCGHGLPYNAFIVADRSCEDKMDALGYESPPDMLDVCYNCDAGIMYVPKSVLEEDAYEER